MFAVLWACRVSVAAVALPLLLFSASDAARDLFWYYAGPLTPGRATAADSWAEAKTVAY